MEYDDARLSRIETLWSVVRRAHGQEQDAVQAAQQSLLDRYGGAVRRYALAALRDEDAADEVFQEFALRFVRGDFGRADPGRGRFRSYVKSAIYRLIVDYQRRRQRQRREKPLPENLPEQPVDGASAEDDELFLASWRDELLSRCWAKLEEQEGNTGKPYHTALRLRADHPELRSGELAERLGHVLGKPTTAGAVRVLLHRARDVFAELLLDEVLQSLADGSLEEAEQELIELDLMEYCRGALVSRRGKDESE